MANASAMMPGRASSDSTEAVLGAGQRQAENIDLLKGIGADQRGTHLTGDGDNGNGIEQRISRASDQVGGAGPEVAMQTPTLPVARA